VRMPSCLTGRRVFCFWDYTEAVLSLGEEPEVPPVTEPREDGKLRAQPVSRDYPSFHRSSQVEVALITDCIAGLTWLVRACHAKGII
jgi:hypothetical protein